MRAVIQRVSSARVTVANEVTGEIGRGLLILLGIGHDDVEADGQWLAEKICALRVFEDDGGKMNLSVRDLGPDSAPRLLVVSQFTLFASTRKGTRPSFNDAARPELAVPLYEAFRLCLATSFGGPVATGRFAAKMDVALVNDGPVTIVIDSKRRE